MQFNRGVAILETEKILRSILLNVKTAKSLKEVELIVENMCDKDWIATANEIAEKIKSEQKQH